MNQYTIDQIRHKVNISLDMLYKNDYLLIENEVHERSISHKLAEYLQQQFPEYHVDCEYNRKGIDIKKLQGIAACRGTDNDRVYPDIVVHIRNTDENLLVIETKSKNNQDDVCDREKLRLFTERKGDYRYQLGLLIRFESSKPDCKWYEDGQELMERDE